MSISKNHLDYLYGKLHAAKLRLGKLKECNTFASAADSDRHQDTIDEVEEQEKQLHGIIESYITSHGRGDYQ